MIREEFENGSERLAMGLMERLQFPLTLGSFVKSLEVSEQYLTKLLKTRMFEGKPEEETRKISQKLAKEYADHGFCINFDEAKSIGLRVAQLDGAELEHVWQIYKLNKEKQELQERIKQAKMGKLMKDLPPGILDVMKEQPERWISELRTLA